ncbi:site-2 protease family protein [Candidatus Woesearchaeota archaeon]|nr:site-2 protease family protein [Candidatus Woesearchaeota archaeon]
MKLKFSREELKDLLKAWLAVSIAFFIVYFGFSFEDFFIKFLSIALIVGAAFILHELAHKFVAVNYGYFAEFRSFDKMLLIGIVLSFFGFIFLAPGAVHIFGNITNDKNGKISVAGPITNIILAVLFLFIDVPFSNFGYHINSWLAFFNMLPFFGLDGSKVLLWNKVMFFIVIGIAGLLTFIL